MFHAIVAVAPSRLLNVWKWCICLIAAGFGKHADDNVKKKLLHSMFFLQLCYKLSRDPHKKCTELIWAFQLLLIRWLWQQGPLPSQHLSLRPGITIQGLKLRPEKPFWNSSLVWLPVLICSSAVFLHLWMVSRQGTGNNFKNCSSCCYHNFHILLTSAVVDSEAATAWAVYCKPPPLFVTNGHILSLAFCTLKVVLAARIVVGCGRIIKLLGTLKII